MVIYDSDCKVLAQPRPITCDLSASTHSRVIITYFSTLKFSLMQAAQIRILSADDIFVSHVLMPPREARPCQFTNTLLQVLIVYLCELDVYKSLVRSFRQCLVNMSPCPQILVALMFRLSQRQPRASPAAGGCRAVWYRTVSCLFTEYHRSSYLYCKHSGHVAITPLHSSRERGLANASPAGCASRRLLMRALAAFVMRMRYIVHDVERLQMTTLKKSAISFQYQVK